MKIPGEQKSSAARVFSLGGGLVFLASLGYFLYSYDVIFARPAESADMFGPLALNVGLFSAFALHHSLFARESVRAWVARASGDLERSVYVWVASLLFVATCYLWQPLAGVVWNVGGPVAWALRGVQLVGIWLAVRSAAIIGIWELSGIRSPGFGARDSGRSNSIREPDPEFKAVGPYSWVRHPIYLGWFLMVLGVPRMTTTQALFALVSCAYVIVAIPFEERSLRRTSRGAYERYARNVRWKLLPFIY